MDLYSTRATRFDMIRNDFFCFYIDPLKIISNNGPGRGPFIILNPLFIILETIGAKLFGG
jgi:hypothetical protein